ncbi:MAG: helix-turn-helix domain-containing protein [Spirochaetia bacterium]|jgi:excisionase family DNA binding protein
MSDAMNTREAAALLGIAVPTLYAWTAEARIPFYRVSARRLRFDRSEIEAWIRERRVPARSAS